MSKRPDEKVRLVTEDKKRQEHLEQTKLNSYAAKKRQETEVKLQREAEEMSRAAAEQMAKSIEESRRQQEEDNQRRLREQEEKNRKLQMEQKQRFDEQNKADDRKRKIEEERRRVLEEEAHRSKNDFGFLTQPPIKQKFIDDEIDLLGGGSEDDRSSGMSDEEHYDLFGGFEAESSTSDNDGITSNKLHRLAPQRGKIDEITDDVLDRLSNPLVSLKKQGRNDGIYILGQRVMKVHIDRTLRQPRVTLANKHITIEEFIKKFEKVEATRMKGLQSAFFVTQMMNTKSFSLLNFK